MQGVNLTNGSFLVLILKIMKNMNLKTSDQKETLIGKFNMDICQMQEIIFYINLQIKTNNYFRIIQVLGGIKEYIRNL